MVLQKKSLNINKIISVFLTFLNGNKIFSRKSITNLKWFELLDDKENLLPIKIADPSEDFLEEEREKMAVTQKFVMNAITNLSGGTETSRAFFCNAIQEWESQPVLSNVTLTSTESGKVQGQYNNHGYVRGDKIKIEGTYYNGIYTVGDYDYDIFVLEDLDYTQNDTATAQKAYKKDTRVWIDPGTGTSWFIALVDTVETPNTSREWKEITDGSQFERVIGPAILPYQFCTRMISIIMETSNSIIGTAYFSLVYRTLQYDKISAVFSDGAGNVLVTTTGEHGLLENDWIKIENSTYYDGRWKVSNVTQNTFTIPANYVSNSTGNFSKYNEDALIARTEIFNPYGEIGEQTNSLDMFIPIEQGREKHIVAIFNQGVDAENKPATQGSIGGVLYLSAPSFYGDEFPK